MRFFLSFVEQGLGSLITLGINLWLIRNGKSQSYGVYVFWFSIAWVLATCQFTLTVVHLSSLPSGRDRLAQRREPERVLFSVTLVILLVASLGVAGANRTLDDGLRETAAMLFIPAFLLYQFVRAFAFSRNNVLLAACLTGGVMVCAGLGLWLDTLAGYPPDASRVLLIVGLAYGLCSIVVLGLIDCSIRPVISRAAWRRYSQYVRSSGWLVLGAGANEVTSRLYSFMVVDGFGPQALARLSAVQVIIRPAWMLSAAWSSIGFPRMATQRADGNRSGLVTTMLVGALVTAVPSGLWSGIVILAWPLISSYLYRGQYGDIGNLAWLWGGNVVLGSIAVALNTATLVVGEYRRLAMIDLVGALACSGSMALLLSRFDYSASIVGTLFGQSMQIILMGSLLTRQLGTRRVAAASAESVS